MKEYFTYILTNESKTVLYVGVTNNLSKRLLEHKDRGGKNSFTAKYRVCRLIYYERYQNIIEAIAREKEIKGWRREKKMELIKRINPDLQFID